MRRIKTSAPRLLRGLLNDDRGQVAILTAVALTALLGTMGLAIDGGLLFTEHRDARNAADGAALAAGKQIVLGNDTFTALSPNPAPCDGHQRSSRPAVDAACDLANELGYNDSEVSVAIPPTSGAFAGQGRIVQVFVTRTYNTLLMRLVGVNTVQVRAPAAAKVSGSGYVLFQQGDEELEIEAEGGDVTIHGDIHGDGEVEVEGKGGSVVTVTGAVTYVDEFEGKGSYSFGSGPTQLGSPPALPEEAIYSDTGALFVYDDFPCGYNAPGPGDWRISTGDTPELFQNIATQTLYPGVYCADGKIKVEQDGVNGNVTFVSHDEVKLEGENFSLTAHWENVLAFTDGDKIKVEGDNGWWDGNLLAPFGEVKMEAGTQGCAVTMAFGKEIEVEAEHGGDICLKGPEGVYLSE